MNTDALPSSFHDALYAQLPDPPWVNGAALFHLVNRLAAQFPSVRRQRIIKELDAYTVTHCESAFEVAADEFSLKHDGHSRIALSDDEIEGWDDYDGEVGHDDWGGCIHCLTDAPDIRRVVAMTTGVNDLLLIERQYQGGDS